MGLKEHYVQSPNHSYCQQCDQHFSDTIDLNAHYETAHLFCTQCRQIFVNQIGLDEHYRQSERHHYCVSCKRLFMSASSLQAHLNSATHKPKDVICPGQGCGQAFVSRSALVLHLESGHCRSGATRQIVDRYVRQYDTSNVITDPSRLLTGGSAGDTVRYSATAAAWNGAAYECYLCHRGYRSLLALNQHLASPAHENKIYLCPLTTCRVRFPTLSGLCQHIESERCGVAKFKVVQNTMQSLMGGMRRLTES
jgi:hypothetical protein